MINVGLRSFAQLETEWLEIQRNIELNSQLMIDALLADGSEEAVDDLLLEGRELLEESQTIRTFLAELCKA